MSDSHPSPSCASDICRSPNDEEREEVCNMIQQVHNLILQSDECAVDAGLAERHLSRLHGAAALFLKAPVQVQLISRANEVGGLQHFVLGREVQGLVDQLQDDQQGVKEKGYGCLTNTLELRRPGVSFVHPRSPSPIGDFNALPGSRSQTASPCFLTETALTNPRLHGPSSPDGDMDSDEESTRGQESSLDVSLAKRKTFPQESSSEGPLVKKSKPFCKRPVFYAPNQKNLALWVKSVAPGRLWPNVRQQSALLPAGRPLAENFRRHLGPSSGLFPAGRPLKEHTCQSLASFSRVPLEGPVAEDPRRLHRPSVPPPQRDFKSSTFSGTLAHSRRSTYPRLSSANPRPSVFNSQPPVNRPPPPPPSSQDASAAPWLIRAAPPTVAPPGLKITPGSQVQNPGPMSSIVNRQSIDLPPHHATSCADNLSGGSLQPDTRSLAVLHPRSPLPSTSGGAAAHSPHLPSSHRGDMQRLRLIIAEAGYILAGTQTGECSASPYGPGSGSGNKACTCCASLPMNQGGSQAGHAARRPIPEGTDLPLCLPRLTTTSVHSPLIPTSLTPARQATIGQSQGSRSTFPRRSEVARRGSRSPFLRSLPAFHPGEGRLCETPPPACDPRIVGGFVRTSPPWFRGAFHERQNRTERSPPISSLRPQWSEEDPWRFVNEENGLHRRAEPLKWHELNHAPPQRMCRR
ncbi:hypothetical protein FA13DRAFT_1716761 [Coprinellus micaceus]|uniref:Uncharacterized protein n=1 Tax=Coprinellus micaceus TaxID=71717 RepID=A0A4Y7SIL1_COPMI|nr:hypothetical protein FA13DRAFT_1716761 [Coprinellus micaceus]